MVYAADGTARFVGLERIKGTVAGKKGSVVLQHVGAFEDGTARAKLTVIPGSGTQGLAGLTGDGEFSAARGPNGEMTLSVSFG